MMRYVVIEVEDGIVGYVAVLDSGREAQARADRVATRHPDAEHYDCVVWDLNRHEVVYNPYRARGDY